MLELRLKLGCCKGRLEVTGHSSVFVLFVFVPWALGFDFCFRSAMHIES